MRSNTYTLGFAAIVCIICSLFVAGAATSLKERQERNERLDVQKNILACVDLLQEAGPVPSPEAIEQLYATRIEEKRLEGTGLPLYIRIDSAGTPEAYAFPIEGKGLWSTLYGFLALEPDATTIKGITFYKHGETPGLGAEIEQPWFQENFKGKKVIDAEGKLASITVVKGLAADRVSPERLAHNVDGISGATMTSKGVTALLRKGLEHYEPFFSRIRKGS